MLKTYQILTQFIRRENEGCTHPLLASKYAPPLFFSTAGFVNFMMSSGGLEKERNIGHFITIPVERGTTGRDEFYQSDVIDDDPI